MFRTQCKHASNISVSHISGRLGRMSTEAAIGRSVDEHGYRTDTDTVDILMVDSAGQDRTALPTQPLPRSISLMSRWPF
jgi:hypothetical protein